MFNHASFIWGAADILRGTYKQHEYGDVILPFTVLFRLDAVLAPTKQYVLDALHGEDPTQEPRLALIRSRTRQTGHEHEYTFFNRSPQDLRTIQGDPDNLEDNLLDYIAGFSENVRDIFEKYRFDETVAGLAQSNLLLQILQHFSKADLHPDTVSNEKMGHIFEELIRKFAEASNETAGEHFTPREVIDLMVTLLIADEQDWDTDYMIREVYDPTAGTGGMLSAADDKLKEKNPTTQVTLLGQEINPASYAVCKADMVVKGQGIDNIVLGNTLTDPAFEDRTFHYCLSNPPFGVDWKQSRADITREHEMRGFAGRFGPGLPRVSDGSLLFLMHLITKMREPAREENQVAGRAAIVLNGSPLFTGGAGSGESNIRKWVLDNDYLEAIIGLPTDMFYNTGIATYVWVLSKDKAPKRKGKVQLIDATGMSVKMRKSVGSKRNMLSAQNITEIERLYREFAESKHSKIFRTEDFFYRTITVERPLRLNFAFTDERIDRAMAARAVTKLPADDVALLRSSLLTLRDQASGEVFMNRAEFTDRVLMATKNAGLALKPALLKTVVTELSEADENGELQVNRVNDPAPDTSLRDTENVPWDEDIHEYLEREVKPFVPDAWIDASKTRDGAEIPFTRHFYEYIPPRPLEEIDRDLDEVLGRIRARLEEVKA